MQLAAYLKKYITLHEFIRITYALKNGFHFKLKDRGTKFLNSRVQALFL